MPLGPYLIHSDLGEMRVIYITKRKNTLVIATAIMAVLMMSSVFAATVTLRPDAQGIYKQWGNVGCASGNSEWQCVDETTLDTTDYLKKGTKDKRESFSFADSGITDATINSVTMHYVARQHKSNRKIFAPLLILNGLFQHIGTSITTTSAWVEYSETFTTNPATSSAWTISEVDALEAGMVTTNDTQRGGQVAQTWAVVDYTPNSKPDYIVDNITFSEYDNTNETRVDVSVRVKNVGAAAATGTSLLSVVFDGTTHIRTISALGVGGSQTFSLDLFCPTAGDDLDATADSANAIAESDETNNDDSVTIDCVV